MEEIAFDVGISDEGSGGICIQIKDEKKQKIILEERVSVQDISNGGYTYVPVKKWLRKGGEYSVSVIVEGMDGVTAIYTSEPEKATPGNKVLYLDGRVIEGQAVMGYVYGFPLNIKNVICLWAFILTVGLAVLELLMDRKTGGNLMVVHKMDELLRKYQIPFLFLELAVILFLIIRICGNEAVDWDEAYTWWITTKNTVPEMISATAVDIHPPLYYLLVIAAMAVFGENIFVAKMVSVAGAG